MKYKDGVSQTDMQQERNHDLEQQLIEAFARPANPLNESDQARQIKAELYRQGYRRGDIVELAVVSLLRRQRRAS